MFKLLVCLLMIVQTEAHDGCHETDDHCTFNLIIAPKLTMWRGFHERVYIDDDESIHIFNVDGTIDPNEVILADGYHEPKVLTLVNGVMPGPPIVVYKDQNVTVNVENQLVGEVISIHWHGIKQKGTPWMDGAGFITQCPISPGQSFQYSFMADTKGTHFYHSHLGGKLLTGLFGPFIVKERQPAVTYPEHILTIQDYNHALTPEDFRLRQILGIVENNGTLYEGHPTIDGAQTTIYDITSFLINGRGRIYENGTSVTKTPFHVFDVEPNMTYRFRVINAASLFQSRLSVDNHTMTVISMDGNDVEPVDGIHSVISHSGERIDFLIQTDQAPGNYWIRLNTLIVGGDYPAYAILRYTGADVENPSSDDRECTTDSKCTWLNCPVENFPEADCVNVDAMRSAGNLPPAPSASTGSFKEFFINSGFAILNSQIRANMNGATLKLPTVSALTQPNQVTNKCSDPGSGCGVERTCECVNSINVDFGDVVQLNLVADKFGPGILVHHPIHLHGYHFHVLKIKYRPSDDNMTYMGTNQDFDCQYNGLDGVCNNATWSNSTWFGGNIPDIDPSRAPLKDTITVPAGGYAVVRFVVDNPGLWHLHCHIVWHTTFAGMGLLINDSFARIPPPPNGFPQCGSFPPVFTGKGNTIHEGPFIWSLSGALLYHIIRMV